MKNSIQKNSGAAVIITLMLSGILLSIAMTLTSIFVPKNNISVDVKNSSAAFYAADSAIEWCLRVKIHGSPVPSPVMSNSSSYVVTPGDCDASSIDARGTYQRVTRAIQVNF